MMLIISWVEGLEYDFRVNNNPENAHLADWSKNRNELYFTKGYMVIFDNPLDGGMDSV